MTEDTKIMFDQFLDEVYGTFQIGTSTFYAADILQDCDPIAYRIALSEYEDMLNGEDND